MLHFDKRELLAISVGVALFPRAGLSQNSSLVPRIGWLTAQSEGSLSPYVTALRAGLAELGYEEGRNIQIAFRYGDDHSDRVEALAIELASAGLRALVVQGSAVPIVSRMGLPIPVIFVTSTDPVSAGLTDNLARPRRNLTGLTFMAAEFNAKRIELLQELVPKLRRVAVIGNPEHPGEHLERAASDDAGRRLGVAVEYHATPTLADLETAFDRMSVDPPDGLSIFGDGFSLANRSNILGFAIQKRIPTVSGWALFARSGALCTYGPRLAASYRRLAVYVDRIIRGAKPADLPIERPTVFELVINLQTARTLGLSPAPTVLARADEVIE